jgi:hypothetical protein
VNIDRRRLLKIGAASMFGAMASHTRLSAAVDVESALEQSSQFQAAHAGFNTRHAIVVIYGNGARKKEIIESPAIAPNQIALASKGTLFTEDFCDTASLHGYMSAELLTGRDSSTERPRFPTWTEYVRKATGLPATKFWMLQPVSRYRGWKWDCKNFSQHPDYGPASGATSLTMDAVFGAPSRTDSDSIVDRHVERGLGHHAWERRQIADFVEHTLQQRKYIPPSTREPVAQRPVQFYDAACLQMAGEVLKAFKPWLITIQLLGLDEAHGDRGATARESGYERYVRHIRATDELIGNLWALVEADPYLRTTTALFIRPDCGRDSSVLSGRLDHSEGDYSSHYVWQLAVGPDFRKGVVVSETVNRRDFAPTVVYALSGAHALYASGHVLTQMFKPEFQLPAYERTPVATTSQPKIDLEALSR